MQILTLQLGKPRSRAFGLTVKVNALRELKTCNFLQFAKTSYMTTNHFLKKENTQTQMYNINRKRKSKNPTKS